ncbi:MAG: helix-hairpin-helix domain-containing protein [Verrucomicrobia bacterium]|nr:helix-hairpin-helix domain-containing protein [Verrucomicrobiota bacterium]
MKKFILFALLTALLIPFSLSAQTKLEENLKSVMLLFDKNRKEAQAEVDTLKAANEQLTERNLMLYQDLEQAENRIGVLEKENLFLRSRISDSAVKEFETAALLMSVPSLSKKNAQEYQDPIPDFTPASIKKLGQPASGADHLSDGTILLVNLNTATERELKMIPGVGPQMAERIINARPFNSIWDLMRLQGMGKNRIERIGPYITTE